MQDIRASMKEIAELRKRQYYSQSNPIIQSDIKEVIEQEASYYNDDEWITDGIFTTDSSCSSSYSSFPLSIVLTIDRPDTILPQFLLPDELTKEIRQYIYTRMTVGEDRLKPEDIVFFKMQVSREERLDPEDIYQLPDDKLLELVDKYNYENSMPEIWAFHNLSILKFMTNKDQQFSINNQIYYLSDEQWAEVEKRVGYNNINVSDTRKEIVRSNLQYQKALFMDRYFNEFVYQK